MYFSQFEISADLARNPYEIHQALWQSFSRTGNEKRDFLFRVNWKKNVRYLNVLVQSMTEPKSVENTSCVLKASKQIEFHFVQGQYLRFAVCVNPVKRSAQDKNRIPLIGEDAQIEWLERHLKGAALLHEAQVVSSHPLYFFKRGDSGKSHRGKIFTIVFDGILEVQDPELFQKIVLSGIGPAKSFGCGLLTLAKI